MTKSKCKTSGAASCVVSGLSIGQVYSVTVMARNTSGWGPASPPVTAAAEVMDAASVIGQGAGAGYCAVTPAGGVDCWGRGANGQLGNGVFYRHASGGSAVPVTVEGVGGVGTLGGVASLASSGENFCALLTSGGVDCWGFNGSYGNLGDGATTDSAVPEEVVGVGGSGALSGVTALAGDGEGYCALLTSGGVDCWGYGEYGEIGDGSFTDSDVPEMVEGVGGTGTLAGVESIVGFGNGYCALLNSGQVACWGEGTFGSLGDGSFSDSAMPMLVEGADGTGTLAGVVYLTSGYGESECALLTSGGLLCWGRGDYGQLGDGTFYTSGNLGSAVPVAVEGVGGTGTLNGVTTIVGYAFTFCALLTSSGVDCWGAGEDGQLGDGTFYTSGNLGSAVPVTVEAVGGTGTLGRVVSLTQGCALLTSGAADCWGRGANGQLGNGAFDDSAAPVIVKGLGGSGTLTDITSIISAATGYCATFASSGTVNCWGGGGTGELGDGIFYTTGNGGSPVPVATEGP